jgi:hypothetical protein
MSWPRRDEGWRMRIQRGRAAKGKRWKCKWTMVAMRQRGVVVNSNLQGCTATGGCAGCSSPAPKTCCGRKGCFREVTTLKAMRGNAYALRHGRLPSPDIPGPLRLAIQPFGTSPASPAYAAPHCARFVLHLLAATTGSQRSSESGLAVPRRRSRITPC